VVSGLDALVGLAGGLILGALIMYYLLKDGTRLRRAVVAQIDPPARDEVDDFIGDACRILREYGRGRTVMSAIVSVVIGVASLLLGLPLVFTIVVVNFVGGYIPYIGAPRSGWRFSLPGATADRRRCRHARWWSPRTCCSRTSWSPR
jgi:predicted PurR-regulated permease PerM